MFVLQYMGKVNIMFNKNNNSLIALTKKYTSSCMTYIQFCIYDKWVTLFLL